MPAADDSAPLGGGGRAAYLAILRDVLNAALDEIDCKENVERTRQDRRQPGGVPGAHPQGIAFLPDDPIPCDCDAEPFTHTQRNSCPIDLEHDEAELPRYRAPLEGTIPPAGRRFMCGSCARSFEGHVMAGCPCGGEIVIVDPGEGEPLPPKLPPTEHAQVRALWQYGIHTPTFHQDERGEIECSCGLILTDTEEARLLERWDAHARPEGS